MSKIFKNTLFDWVEIPVGKVTHTNTRGNTEDLYLKRGESCIFEIPAFAIAKYPVTNAQFAMFIDAKGYERQKW
jgi:formylglycine-generating enzyme required for sulfatase activity